MDELDVAEPKTKTKSKPKSATKRKPARKTAAAKKSLQPSAEKTALKKRSDTDIQKVANAISQEQRRELIAKAAYLRAEKHGFNTDPVDDWLTAEVEVDKMLNHRNTGITLEA
jgi:hypothetical protein